jgi:hypothetical protein
MGGMVRTIFSNTHSAINALFAYFTYKDSTQISDALADYFLKQTDLKK